LLLCSYRNATWPQTRHNDEPEVASAADNNAFFHPARKMPIATASQAWAILVRHARDEIQSLRLQELCQDNHRVSSLVTVQSNDDSTLIVDFSRQRMTLETVDHLLHLANARGCIDLMQEELPYHNPPNAMYLALRAPHGSSMLLSDTQKNACQVVHTDWDRVQRISEGYRRGQLRGITGAVLRDVVVVGSGVPMHSLRFLYDALLQDPTGSFAAKDGLAELLTRRTFTTSVIEVGHRRLRLVSSVDSLAATKAVEDLDPASTLVISLAMTGHEETGLASRLLKNWLLKALSGSARKPDLIFSKHMLLVTANDRLYQASKPESVFSIPSFCRSEPFCTLSTLTLLPLSIIFGWTLVHDGLLAGAHAMDAHMVESNPRHNLPLLLALVDLWNDAFLPSTPGRLIQNFGEAFSQYGAYVASLESQVCGGPSQPAFSDGSCGTVLTSSACYDRSLYQATRMVPSELVMTLDPPIKREGFPHMEVLQHHDALLCSMFGHADEMAAVSNRPSTLLLCGRLNAYTCGQLIALAEHRSILKAKLWNMTPLFPTQAGVALRTTRTDKLIEDLAKLVEKTGLDGDDEIQTGITVNLSTATLLSNYADRTRELRTQIL
jgi:glucose-6-phosphate isomerase